MTALEVAGLTKRYGLVRALYDVSFSVGAGEILGYLGPNGAGKTTTLRILSGLMRPTAGRALLAGYDVATHPQEVKRAIGFLTAAMGVFVIGLWIVYRVVRGWLALKDGRAVGG